MLKNEALNTATYVSNISSTNSIENNVSCTPEQRAEALIYKAPENVDCSILQIIRPVHERVFIFKSDDLSMLDYKRRALSSSDFNKLLSNIGKKHLRASFNKTVTILRRSKVDDYFKNIQQAFCFLVDLKAHFFSKKSIFSPSEEDRKTISNAENSAYCKCNSEMIKTCDIIVDLFELAYAYIDEVAYENIKSSADFRFFIRCCTMIIDFIKSVQLGVAFRRTLYTKDRYVRLADSMWKKTINNFGLLIEEVGIRAIKAIKEADKKIDKDCVLECAQEVIDCISKADLHNTLYLDEEYDFKLQINELRDFLLLNTDETKTQHRKRLKTE